MTRRFICKYRSSGYRRLANPGQRIKLGQDADHRFALTKTRNKRCWDLCNASLNFEAFGSKGLLQELTTSRLLIAKLSIVPDF